MQMKTWTDFLTVPAHPAEVAGLGPAATAMSTTQAIPSLGPNGEQNQLQADISAACADIKEQIPNGSWGGLLHQQRSTLQPYP